MTGPAYVSPWLTVAEAVTYTKRAKTTVHEALRDGSLLGSQPMRNGKPLAGGKWLIHRDDLDRWVRGEIAPARPARVTRPRVSA